jgi:hypothetical protein
MRFEKIKNVLGLRMSIPVLVYHHVNNTGLEFSPADFDKQMKFLADNGYSTVFLDDLVAFIAGEADLPPKTVAITFDDGYLDNWVYAYPILKKYGHKATIFVITARIPDKAAGYRPNLEDVWKGNTKSGDLPKIDSHKNINLNCVMHETGSLDYLSWEEAKAMEDSGLIDIQSHTHLHNDIFISDEIIDYNRNTDPKIGWRTGGDYRFGIPLYRRKSAVAALRYFDDKSLRDKIAGYAKDLGQHPQLRQKLNKMVKRYRAENGEKGYYESPEAGERRIIGELSLSKEIIEKKLNKKCKYICWPWGEHSELSIKCAKRSGFRAAITFSPGSNAYAAGRFHIKRIPPAKSIDLFERQLSVYSNSILAEYDAIKNELSHIRRKIKKRIGNFSFC